MGTSTSGTNSDRATTGDIDISQLPTQITGSLATADANVTQSVGTLAAVHAARLARQVRTVQSLSANDPASAAAVAAVNATTATVARLSVVNRQVAIPAVTVSGTGWALHGRVITAQLQPAARFTVFLVDANKTYLAPYGFAYTDDTGYFLINSGGPTPTGGIVPAMPPAFLEVVNTDKNPVYLATDPFIPTTAAAIYQTITLPADGKPIGDPPPAIRAIAQPKQ